MSTVLDNGSFVSFDLLRLVRNIFCKDCIAHEQLTDEVGRQSSPEDR